jgi:hypothetical protein
MSTPKEFLDRLKTHFRFEPVIEGGIKSEEFSAITKSEFEKFEGAIKEKYKNYSIEDDHIVLDLVEDVLPVLTPLEIESIEKCAFGKIYNTKMNAFCAKSKDGFDNYCIVINEGLLMLLHKYGKLIIAQANAKNVTFCNRGNLQLFSEKDYAEFANELIQNYKDYKTPVGAMIKLTHESTVSHSFILHFQELFVLCHELGHLFNKDLEEEQNLMNLFDSEANVLEENKFHEIEYKADSYAFDLVSRVAKQKYKIDKKQILPFFIMLFDIMALIDPNKSEKHPAAIDRITNIIYSNWDKQTADNYLKTYSEEISAEDFFNNL